MGDAGATNRGGPRPGALLTIAAAALIALPPLAGLLAAGPLGSRSAARAEIAAPAPESAVPVPEATPEANNTTEDTLPVDGLPTLAQTALDTFTPASGPTTGPGGAKGWGDTDGPTPGTVEQRGAAALALIDYPWQRTGYSVAFAGPNGNLMGFTEGSRKLITIHVRPGQSARSIAWVLGHEIGHAVDFTMTTDAERATYRRIRGLGDRPWYPTCPCSDYASPAGDWAETFAAWLLGDGPFASLMGPRPSAAQLSALTPVFTADAVAVATPTTRPPVATTTTRAPAPVTAPKPTTPTTVRRSITPRPRSTTPTTSSSTPTTTKPWWTTTTRPTTTTTRPLSTTTTRPTTTTTSPPSTTTTTRPPSTTTTRPSTTTTTAPPTTTTKPTSTTTTTA